MARAQQPKRETGQTPGGMDAVQRAFDLFQQGRARAAMRELAPLLDRPQAPQVEQKARRLQGVCLQREGFHEEAAQQLGKAAAMAGADGQLQYEWAQALHFAGRIDESERVARELLSREPDHPEAIALLARVLQSRGRHEEAGALIDEASGRGIDHPALTVALAGSARRLAREEEAIERLEALGARTSLPAGQRQEALFQDAALLDKLGRCDEAFAHYERAHGLVRASYDPRATTRDTDELIRAWTPKAIVGGPRGRDLNQTPIFVVGMPRSGTTLVENILGAHPAVFGAGELMQMSVVYRELIHKPGQPLEQSVRALDARQAASGAQNYLTHLKRLAPGAERVVDKHPLNFLHLGLIAKLFPGARVIHTVRDPRDTCLSCYFRNFLNAMSFATDQRWLGSFYCEYARLMEHWRQTLPGAPVDLRFTEIRYEDIIADQEGASRRLIEFAGLDWDEGVMRFHERPRPAPTLNADEIGRPVYATSVAKWKAYEKHIGPLLRSLGPVLGPVPGGDGADRPEPGA